MNKLTVEERYELIDELEELNNELAHTVERISNICNQFDDRNANMYLIAPLQIVVETGGWVSNDLSLPKWIQRLREETCEEEE